MRKEYEDRWSAPLVNEGITLGEYEKDRNETKHWEAICKEWDRRHSLIK